MCNRFRSVANWDLVRPYCTDLDNIKMQYNPNVAPTNQVPVIRSGAAGQRILAPAAFGVTPKWSPPGTKPPLLTNARVETIHTRRTFKNLFGKRRCVVPAEGYYEWREEGGRKQPYLFTRADGGIMFLAGLWDETKTDGQNPPDYSFLIVTGEPNSLAAPIHDRMPCLIDGADIADWLDLGQPGDEQLIIYPSELLQVHRVNPAMNKSSVKDAAVIDAVGTLQAA